VQETIDEVQEANVALHIFTIDLRLLGKTNGDRDSIPSDTFLGLG